MDRKFKLTLSTSIQPPPLTIKTKDSGTSCGYEGWQTFVRRLHPRLVVSNFLAKKADGSKKDSGLLRFCFHFDFVLRISWEWTSRLAGKTEIWDFGFSAFLELVRSNWWKSQSHSLCHLTIIMYTKFKKVPCLKFFGSKKLHMTKYGPKNIAAKIKTIDILLG